MFDVVDRAVAPRRTVRLGETFEPLPGLKIELFAVPGKVPLWLEEGKSASTTSAKAQSASRRMREAAGLVYAPGCAHVTEELDARIGKADVLFFDGTLFTDDEMIASGLGEKSAGAWATCRSQDLEERWRRLRAMLMCGAS